MHTPLPCSPRAGSKVAVAFGPLALRFGLGPRAARVVAELLVCPPASPAKARAVVAELLVCPPASPAKARAVVGRTAQRRVRTRMARLEDLQQCPYRP